MNSIKPQHLWSLLLLILLVEPFYRQYLFDASIPIIISLQASATPEWIQFFQTVSFIGAGGIPIAVILGGYIFWPRSYAFYYLTYFAEIFIVMNIGKMAYHSPRPYMVNDEVQVFGCATEFGHPSGHAIISMTLCIGLLIDYFTSPNTDGIIKKALISIVAIGTPLLVGFSRLYNGDHTMD